MKRTDKGEIRRRNLNEVGKKDVRQEEGDKERECDTKDKRQEERHSTQCNSLFIRREKRMSKGLFIFRFASTTKRGKNNDIHSKTRGRKIQARRTHL